MLHILWLLLKIIGIIILAILGMLILLVSVVLFVPFRYRADATVSGELSSLKAEAKISWMFRLIYGYVSYEENKLDWQFRVFWKKFNVDKEQADFIEDDEMSETGAPVQNKEIEKDTSVTQIKEAEDECFEEESVEDSTPKSKVKEKNPRFFEKIKYTFQNICDKIKMLKRKKEQLEEFLSDEVHKSSWSRLVRELIQLLKYIRPKKLKINVHFGFEDPSITGRVLAVLGMLYPFYVDSVNVRPDFENKIIEGNLFMKGHLHSIHLLMTFLHLFFDKNVKVTYKTIMNWGK